MQRPLPPFRPLVKMRAAELGLSQADLACRLSISVWRLSRVLTGVSPIRQAELSGLARILKLPKFAGGGTS